MMKRTLLPLLLVLVTLSLPRDIRAADAPKDNSLIHLSFGLQTWLSRADAKWQISFPYITASGQSGRIESELTYNEIDSPLIIITGGMGKGPYFSFDALLGTGAIESGRSTDTDRFVSNTGGGLEFSQSISDIRGDVMLVELNFYYNNHRFTGKHLGPWGAVLGYTHYQDKLTVTNGVQTVSVPFNGSPSQPLGPFPYLSSTYDFYWDAIKIGILPQFDVTDRLSISGMFAFYPLVWYRGEAYWNLRTAGPNAFRIQSPNFIQESTTGHGYEVSLGLTYALQEQVELTAGYRYLYLYAEDGTDTTYFADGSVSETDLDWVTVNRQGAYFEMVVKF